MILLQQQTLCRDTDTFRLQATSWSQWHPKERGNIQTESHSWTADGEHRHPIMKEVTVWSGRLKWDLWGHTKSKLHPQDLTTERFCKQAQFAPFHPQITVVNLTPKSWARTQVTRPRIQAVIDPSGGITHWQTIYLFWHTRQMISKLSKHLCDYQIRQSTQMVGKKNKIYLDFKATN